MYVIKNNQEVFVFYTRYKLSYYNNKLSNATKKKTRETAQSCFGSHII